MQKLNSNTAQLYTLPQKLSHLKVIVEMTKSGRWVDTITETWRTVFNIHAFFYKQRFFSTHPHCCLIFS